MKADTFHQKNGLHGLHWPAPSPKAVVCIVHGLGEHVGRYAHVAAFFTKKNMAVMGLDLPGFGRSPGKRGHVPGFGAFMDAIAGLIAQAGEWYPGVPVFLYGQSMGGNLVLNFLIKYPDALAGCIASSPWIRLATKPSPLRVALAKMTKSILPALAQPNGLDIRELATDPAVAEAYRTDPLTHDRITTATGLALLDAADFLDHFDGDVPAPLLLLHGSADRLTDPAGTIAFAERAKGNVTLNIWDGMKHELHNEPILEEVLAYIFGWVSGVLSGE